MVEVAPLSGPPAPTIRWLGFLRPVRPASRNRFTSRSPLRACPASFSSLHARSNALPMLGNVAPPKTPMGINRRTDNTATRTPSACVPYTRRRNLGGEIGRELGDHRWNSSPRRVARFATQLDSGPHPPLPHSSDFKVLLRFRSAHDANPGLPAQRAILARLTWIRPWAKSTASQRYVTSPTGCKPCR